MASFLQDMIVSAAVTAGGVWLLSQLNEKVSYAQMAASCVSGGAALVGNPIGTWDATTQQCMVNGQPVATSYTGIAGPVTLAAPPLAGVLVGGMSWGSVVGAGLVELAVAFMAISAIH